jgi:hypothetical protein
MSMVIVRPAAEPVNPGWSRWLWPSWLLSLLLHVVTLLLLFTYLRNQTSEPAGFSDDPGREVGIVLKSSAIAESVRTERTEGPAAEEALDPTPTEETLTSPLAAPATVSPAVPMVTADTPNIIGAGPIFPAGPPADPRELIKSAGTNSVAGGLAAAVPGAAFMGAKDNGTRVVFAIDCSASMSNHNAMRSAKAALVSSLQSLSDTQQFQVIFYNQKPQPLSLRGTKGELYLGTEVNKTLARQQIGGVMPDLGTDHLPALKMALRMGPEVLFFLTDADEPQLSSGELEEVQRLNRGRTRIHTIEFGTGGATTVDNFLKKLARQNGGTYRYYDVKRLATSLP